MPILALFTSIFIRWVIKGRIKIVKDDVAECGHRFKAEKFYDIRIKFIAPVCVILIFIYMVSSLL